jgi:hypothetical protein
MRNGRMRVDAGCTSERAQRRRQCRHHRQSGELPDGRSTRHAASRSTPRLLRSVHVGTNAGFTRLRQSSLASSADREPRVASARPPPAVIGAHSVAPASASRRLSPFLPRMRWAACHGLMARNTKATNKMRCTPPCRRVARPGTTVRTLATTVSASSTIWVDPIRAAGALPAKPMPPRSQEWLVQCWPWPTRRRR